VFRLVLKELMRRSGYNVGMLLLGIWLIATGLLPFLNVHIPHSSTILSVVAAVAGVLILMGR